MSKKILAALAVRDGAELLLVFTVDRSPDGDVYVNYPRDQQPDWKPHASYHASGQHHQKSFNRQLVVAHRQRPDASFRGTENIVTTGLSSDEPRLLNKPCRATEYLNVFEIPLADLRPENYRTLVSFDLAEPGAPPIITPGAKILRQFSVQDRWPSILITLFENIERSGEPWLDGGRSMIFSRTNAHILSAVAASVSAIASIFAAALWFWSAEVTIPDPGQFPIVVVKGGLGELMAPLEGRYVGSGNSPQLQKWASSVTSAFALQSQRSAWAAKCAAVAAGLAAVAAFLEIALRRSAKH